MISAKELEQIKVDTAGRLVAVADDLQHLLDKSEGKDPEGPTVIFTRSGALSMVEMLRVTAGLLLAKPTTTTPPRAH